MSEIINKEQGFLKGLATSSGIAIGVAKVIQPENLILPNEKISFDEVDGEVDRYLKAIEIINKEFEAILDIVSKESNNVTAILETNLIILNDPLLNSNIVSIIQKGYSAESSLIQEFEKQKSFFKNSKDQIIMERAIELDHIKQRILSELRHFNQPFSVAKDAILVVQSLTPTDLVNYKDAGLLGIITEVGGLASHVSILARSFEIPAVIGVKDATNIIKDNDVVIIDGFSGGVVYNPKKNAMATFIKKREEIRKHKEKLGKLVKVDASTTDGKRIYLKVNVDRIEDIQTGMIVGADGSGLVRSESQIFLNNSIPNEEEQYHWYKQIADIAFPNLVTIRIFDIGSDKFSEGIPHHEDNPALGFRGIRYLLNRKDVLRTQLRAILRASTNKNIRIMLPMIISINEVKQTLNIFNEIKNDLIKNDIYFDSLIQIGIMIETPSAALIAEDLAKIVDFFSIGTNDLTQYTLATDRTNELVSENYDSFHPAVLKLIKLTVDAASKHNKPVGICGELASHSAATNMLIGMGIEELSVVPSLILEMKDRIIKINYLDASKLVENILNIDNSHDILNLLESETLNNLDI